MKKLLVAFLLLFCVQSLFCTAMADFIFKGGYLLDTGEPASGYFLYVYAAGTTTYKESWSVREEGAAYLKTQPIVLDSRGAIDNFFLRGVYKFVLKDTDLVTVKTWDNVDYTQNTGATINLVDSGDTIQVYFDAEGVSYINGGYVGIGISIPLKLLHLKDGSPTIRLEDETDTQLWDIKNSSNSLQFIDSTNTQTPLTIDEDGSIKLLTGATVEDIVNNANVDTDTATASDSALMTEKAATTAFETLEFRSDPAAYDYDKLDFLTDEAYHDLDLSSIAPAGASAVILKVVISEATAAGSLIAFRKNGDSNTAGVTQVSTQVAGQGYTAQVIVECDSSQVIEYVASNKTFTAINVLVKGWFK